MKLLLAIPFVYFYYSRVKRPSGLLFTAVNEWLISILILWYYNFSIEGAVASFALGYMGFIAIYEIGYIFNDFYSVKFEMNPRKRVSISSDSRIWVIIWVFVRLVVAGLLFFWLEWHLKLPIWGTYVLLAVIFCFHNLLQNDQLKLITFLGLAILRIFVPMIPFLSSIELLHLIPGFLCTHILYRTLSYANSKGILNMPDRKQPMFRVHFFLLAGLVVGSMAMFTENLIAIYLWLFYLIAWAGFAILKPEGETS